MTSFVKQFYSSSPYIPRMLLIQYPLKDPALIETWLSGKKGVRGYTSKYLIRARKSA